MPSSTARRVAAILTVAIAVTAPSMSRAQQTTDLPVVKENVVVTANATPTEAVDVASSITVIDREAIEASHASSTLELLRTVPGLEIVQAGGPGRAASVMLRGAASSHTLVLIDGIRVNSPATGGYDLADLRTDQVERVEVLRGPQSSLYGSEAIGGVINVITRRGQAGDRLAVAAELGTAGSSRIEACGGGASGPVDYRFTVSQERVDGLSVASEASGNHEKDPYRARSAVGSLGLSLPRGAHATLNVHSLHATTGLDGFTWGIGPTDDPNYTQDRRQLTSSLTVEMPQGDHLHHTLRLGSDREELVGRDPDTELNRYSVSTRVLSASWQGDVTLGPTDVLSFGLSRELRHGANRGGYDENVGISSAFAQNQWSPARWLHVTAAARLDAHSVFGAHPTYRGTVVALPGPAGLRLHGSWGTGFMAPTFNDLFFPGFGNPDLRPETSRGWDAGVGWESAGRRFLADLTWFDSRIEDLIGFDFTTFRAANVNRARVRGIDISARTRVTAAIDLTGSYTSTDSEDVRTGQPLPRRPRHRATLGLVWKAGPRLDGSVLVVAVQHRTDSDSTRLDDYQRLDAAVEYRVSSGLGVVVRGSNLLDQRYEELSGYTSPGRLVSLGLKVNL